MARRPDIRMLALDVDGTLAARGDEITPLTREALHRAASSGIEVVIATGRRYRSTRRVIEALGLPVCSVVLSGGLVKEVDGRTLHAARFEGHFEMLRELILDAGHSILCQRDSAAVGGPDFVVDSSTGWNDATKSYFERQQPHGASADLSRGGCPDAVAIGVMGDERELRDLQALLAREHGERFLTSIVPLRQDGVWYFELLPDGISKWSGLCALAERAGIGHDAICAVGDEMNDLSMIRGAGLGVAMGNAHEAVKAVADWTTHRCDEDGVAAVVERLLG